MVLNLYCGQFEWHSLAEAGEFQGQLQVFRTCTGRKTEKLQGMITSMHRSEPHGLHFLGTLCLGPVGETRRSMDAEVVLVPVLEETITDLIFKFWLDHRNY